MLHCLRAAPSYPCQNIPSYTGMAGMMTTRCRAAQMGYNLLYGLWKYAWDADCELFLKILEGETKEDVYVQQVQLQVPILNCLPACLPVFLPAGMTGLPPNGVQHWPVTSEDPAPGSDLAC